MLTSADVEQKTFSTALRGYDLDEVDDFLDEVVTTIRTLTEQLEEATVAAAEAPAVAAAEPVPEPPVMVEPEAEPEQIVERPKPEIDESAIGRALIAAQTAADQLLEDARNQADKIVEGAKTEADSWTAEQEAKRIEAEAEIARLASRVASVRSELSVLAGEVSEKLDEMDSVIHESVETVIVSGLEDDDEGGESDVEGMVGGGEERELETGDRELSDEGPDEAEELDEHSEGSDHLDAMLTGVEDDLQLNLESENHEDDSDEIPEDSDRDEHDEDRP